MNLVVMAAGMGSRFGGLKQLTPVGKNGEFLIDYSIYDAILCGVEKVIFIIRKEHDSLFRETIGKRIEKKIKVEYVYQDMNDLPCECPKNIKREKPWGTGHALYSARYAINSSFIIINSDDFYGRESFKIISEFLKNNQTDIKKHYAMVGYYLKNTLSNNGTVTRGICEVDNNYYLARITETKNINHQDNKIFYTIDDKKYIIPDNTMVSVNLFGFTKDILEDVEGYLKDFFKTEDNLENAEFYLPTIVRKSIEDKKADMKVLNTNSNYFGMTYKEDLEELKIKIRKLIENGVYPDNLWEEEA